MTELFESTKAEEASSTAQVLTPPVLEVIQTSAPVPFIPSVQVPAAPVPMPFSQIKISYPPERRKLTVEKGESSTSINSKPQRKVFDICHAPGERVPYVQKTLEEATFEHNKAHPWNFKDLFKRKDYVYLSRDKLAKSCFACHFAANCKFNHFNQILHQALHKQKPTSKRTSIEKPYVNKVKKNQQASVVDPSAASKDVGKQVKPKKTKDKLSAATKSVVAQAKSSASKSAADKPKSSAAKKSAADKLKSSAAKSGADKANPSAAKAKSAADKEKRTERPSPQQWKAKIPVSITPRFIIGSGQPGHKNNTWVVDSGCSRHMTGNRSILSNFRHFNGGYVTFGSEPKGGSITGQGTVSNERMSIDKVNYVKELDFNLMSVSQVCDQKHWMLFTDKECFVLSPGLSIPPPEKILLTAQRKENLYVLDMNDVTPSGSVFCFLSKASVDESALWHRRLSHVNIKTINKLVKDNLVRGLPGKEF
ncbi:hypothetical protein L1987_27678 [Smallanthus sonchifolius]|uniref:Uncharacterized protein n=1 Tax=Smallanthus sonchifolius TaxID=185202 RepID=A0ACB9ICI1_9ASTR|nr:hypothetical protein L1987_27678 [Smallanthus sonchifolius]